METVVDCRKDVLSVLHYYNFFQYPLLAREIRGNCSGGYTPDEVQATLDDLKKTGNIFTFQRFYGLDKDIKRQTADRIKGNQLARQKIKKAVLAGKIIYLFPFVRFVGISGSLSKGYAKPESDFDFFVITDVHRLWICRTLLHLFKKTTFPFRQQHKFCMNYFVDMSHLTIEEQNIYTAIELSSLIPIAGKDVYIQFIQSNRWTKKILPNGYLPFWQPEMIFQKRFFWKEVFQKIPNNWAERLNHWLMIRTDIRWRRKWKRKKFPMKDYDMAFKTTLYHSKNHPGKYQKKLLDHLNNHLCPIQTQ